MKGLLVILFIALFTTSLLTHYAYPSKFSEYGVIGKIIPSETGTTTFQIEIEDRIFDVVINGEDITSLAFNKEEKSIVLQNNRTEGLLEIEIPKELLDGEFTVMIDEQNTDFDLSETGTHSTLLFEKTKDSSIITIQGTTAVPEFPVAIALFAITVAIIIAARAMSLSKSRKYIR